jgi:hypothetical protein
MNGFRGISAKWLWKIPKDFEVETIREEPVVLEISNTQPYRETLGLPGQQHIFLIAECQHGAALE